jgi:NitT/TauT family transport system ATP-binding protein
MKALTIGFMPLLDSAVLVAAAEFGFAAAEGLELTLVRETSWANIRDRIIVGQFDAAHMLGPMALASTLGIGHLRVPMIAPCALGLGGNAITLSTALWTQMSARGAVIGAPLAALGAALRLVVTERARAADAPLTFGMVYPFSCHNYELRYWLSACGIDPDRDVRLVVIPPPFLVDALRAGEIDGFCVGEPWNSVAVDASVGVIAAPTTAIWPHSAEKVLGCRQNWALEHPEQLAALVRALYKAARWCGASENHSPLARVLAAPHYVGLPAELLLRSLMNRLALEAGGAGQVLEDFFVTAPHAATCPWVSHALWFYSQMVRWRQVEMSDENCAAARTTYRPDLYRMALAPIVDELPRADSKSERFFDGDTFDPTDLEAYIRRDRH